MQRHLRRKRTVRRIVLVVICKVKTRKQVTYARMSTSKTLLEGPLSICGQDFLIYAESGASAVIP